MSSSYADARVLEAVIEEVTAEVAGADKWARLAFIDDSDVADVWGRRELL